MTPFFFILYSIILIFLSIKVIWTKNPIHSLLYLVLVFFFNSIMLIAIGCEFISLLILIVYIGALMVLFLFIIMMLNIKLIELEAKVIKYLPIALFSIVAFIFELYWIISYNLNINVLNNKYSSELYLFDISLINWFYSLDAYNNITSIADLLFTKYASLFILASLVLLVAMIGSIILTLNNKTTGIEQNIYKQIMQKYNIYEYSFLLKKK